jgi:hypothetical protein
MLGISGSVKRRDTSKRMADQQEEKQREVKGM